MLDSSVCVALLRNQAPELRQQLVAVRGSVGISAIVACELWTGVERSGRSRSAAALSAFLQDLEVVDWPGAAAVSYARLRAQLERSGQMIGALDMMIAAHALYERATLVTDNVREFRRVPGLKVENWMRR